MWVCGCVCVLLIKPTSGWLKFFPLKKAMQITSLSAVKKVFNWACRKLPPLFAHFWWDKCHLTWFCIVLDVNIIQTEIKIFFSVRRNTTWYDLFGNKSEKFYFQFCTLLCTNTMSNFRNDHSVVQEKNSSEEISMFNKCYGFPVHNTSFITFLNNFFPKNKNKKKLFFNFSVSLEMKQHQLTQKSKSLFYNKHLFCPEIESILKLFTRVVLVSFQKS